MRSPGPCTTLNISPSHEPDSGEHSGWNVDPLSRVKFGAPSNQREAPPSYEEAMDPASAPPPSYDSLFGRVCEVHKESSGTVDFIKNVILLLAGTIGCSIFIGITIVVPISMIVMGSAYFLECPLNYRIPVYLVIGGSCGILKQLLHIKKRCERWGRENINDDEEDRISTFQNGLSCFITGWFILGSFWIYKEFEPNYNPSAGLYCNKTVYLFAFWQVTAVYIVLGVMSMCLCTISLMAMAVFRKQIQMANS